MWEAGVIPDSAFKADGAPVSQPLLMATSSVAKPRLPQLAALGYKMEAFLKKTGAQLWIEHNVATFKRLKIAPEYF